jgi:hypothetical protein
VYRIDRDLAWSPRDLELLPRERREVNVPARFSCQIYCPADSVSLITLEALR